MLPHSLTHSLGLLDIICGDLCQDDLAHAELPKEVQRRCTRQQLVDFEALRVVLLQGVEQEDQAFQTVCFFRSMVDVLSDVDPLWSQTVSLPDLQLALTNLGQIRKLSDPIKVFKSITAWPMAKFLGNELPAEPGCLVGDVSGWLSGANPLGVPGRWLHGLQAVQRRVGGGRELPMP